MTTTKLPIKIKRNKTNKQNTCARCIRGPLKIFFISHIILLCTIRWCIAMPCRWHIFHSWNICNCQKRRVKLSGVTIMTAFLLDHDCFSTWSWKCVIWTLYCKLNCIHDEINIVGDDDTSRLRCPSSSYTFPGICTSPKVKKSPVWTLN